VKRTLASATGIIIMVGVGPWALERVAAELDPPLAVAVAWARRGEGPARTVGSAPFVTTLDPWGRRFDWAGRLSVDADGQTSACSVLTSCGPNGGAFLLAEPSGWRGAVGAHPRLTSLVMALYLALATALLRLAARRTRARDALLAIGVALPLLPVAAAVATTARVTATAPPHLLVPASIGIGAALWLPALLGCLAARLWRRAP
jgi:hypothetical protein